MKHVKPDKYVITTDKTGVRRVHVNEHLLIEYDPKIGHVYGNVNCRAKLAAKELSDTLKFRVTIRCRPHRLPDGKWRWVFDDAKRPPEPWNGLESTTTLPPEGRTPAPKWAQPEPSPYKRLPLYDPMEEDVDFNWKPTPKPKPPVPPVPPVPDGNEEEGT